MLVRQQQQRSAQPLKQHIRALQHPFRARLQPTHSVPLLSNLQPARSATGPEVPSWQGGEAAADYLSWRLGRLQHGDHIHGWLNPPEWDGTWATHPLSGLSSSSMQISEPVSLLDLPEDGLLAVLQYCADDQRSLCNAARAHSRLHQAVVSLLSSITAIADQEQLDSLQLYVSQYGQKIGSFTVSRSISSRCSSQDAQLESFYRGMFDPPRMDSLGVLHYREQLQMPGAVLRQLPPTPHLHSLTLNGEVIEQFEQRFKPFDYHWQTSYGFSRQAMWLRVQLQPFNGFQGVLGAGLPLPLKHLHLKCCTLLDGAAGLAGALSMLPGLEHLTLDNVLDGQPTLHIRSQLAEELQLAGGVLDALQHVQKLTHLDLRNMDLKTGWPTTHENAFKPLRALSQLVRLRLQLDCSYTISTNMLSGSAHLTYLELKGQAQKPTSRSKSIVLEPGALAGKTKLQDLHLEEISPVGLAAGVVQCLQQLQELTQLTHLHFELSADVYSSLVNPGNPVDPPAAVFAALTASSKLQHLAISGCQVLPEVWQQVFPAGRLLPCLQSLQITAGGEVSAVAPDGTLLGSCCPGLKSLSLCGVHCSGEQLTALQGLSCFISLSVKGSLSNWGEVLNAVCQLTGLRDLSLGIPDAMERPLQLTRLQQLTSLSLGARRWSSAAAFVANCDQGPWQLPGASQEPMLPDSMESKLHSIFNTFRLRTGLPPYYYPPGTGANAAPQY